MGWTKFQIYTRELNKLLEDGVDYKEAERTATERAEEIYWDMVDQGRQVAKDGGR